MESSIAFSFLDRRRRIRRRTMSDQYCVYHVMSRTVRRSFWLDDEAREMLVRMLYRQAAFAGVEVYSYCMMGNHFHLLVGIPEGPIKADGQHLVSDEEILLRYEAFYGDSTPRSTFSTHELKTAFELGGVPAERARRMVLARMGNLSAFMKELKQRFGIWFNAKHGNRGTIWEDRFKSVIVERSAEVMIRVCAYIDLNPVRAGMVEHPGDYRWSGYAAAGRGNLTAQSGIRRVFVRDDLNWKDAAIRYRSYLLARGRVGRSDAGESSGPENGRSETGSEVPHRGEGGILRRRIASFSQSIVLGKEDFVKACQSRFSRGRGVRRPCWGGWQAFLAQCSGKE